MPAISASTRTADDAQCVECVIMEASSVRPTSRHELAPAVSRAAHARLKRNDAPTRQWRVMAHPGAPNDTGVILQASMAKRPEGHAQNSATASRRLDSWKEIASFLGRGIRTVQRWEREEGLPVHRLRTRNAAACSPTRELTAWWESRRRPEPAPQPPHAHRTARRLGTRHHHERCDILAGVVVRRAHGRVRLRCGQDGDSPQVWLQQVGGAAVQLTSGLRDCAEPTFSADDTRVLFSATGESTRNVYEIPTLGGPPRVVRRAARNARFSPDGKWFAYIAIEPRDTRCDSSPTGGGAERTLAHRPRRHRVRHVV